MTGFANAILGGASTLIRKAIKSPNYITGSAGWSINKDGSAEFNNLTLRGTFNGTDYVINSAGIFVYNGVPAAGNLVASIAAADGIDGFGNTFYRGLVSYDVVSGAVTYYTILRDGNLSFHYNGAGLFTTAGQVLANEPLNVTQSPSTEITSPSDFAFDSDHASIKLFGKSKDGTSPTSILISTNGTKTLIVTVNGSIVATQPGTTASETWHPLTLINSWTNYGSSHPNAQYRLLAAPPNTVEVIGRISHPSISGTSVIANALPLIGYAPTNSQDHVVAAFGTAAPTSPPVLTLDTTATLTLFDLPTGTTSVAFHCLYSLDA